MHLILSSAGAAVVAAGQAAEGQVLACSGWLAVLRTAACDGGSRQWPDSRPAPTSGAGGCADKCPAMVGFRAQLMLLQIVAFALVVSEVCG